jgi:hypothetical protein
MSSFLIPSWATKTFKTKTRTYRKGRGFPTSGGNWCSETVTSRYCFFWRRIGTDERYLFCTSPNWKRLLLGSRGVGRFDLLLFFSCLYAFPRRWFALFCKYTGTRPVYSLSALSLLMYHDRGASPANPIWLCFITVALGRAGYGISDWFGPRGRSSPVCVCTLGFLSFGMHKCPGELGELWHGMAWHGLRRDLIVGIGIVGPSCPGVVLGIAVMSCEG